MMSATVAHSQENIPVLEERAHVPHLAAFCISENKALTFLFFQQIASHAQSVNIQFYSPSERIFIVQAYIIFIYVLMLSLKDKAKVTSLMLE